MPEARYKRVLLKLSGEALSGQHRYGIDNPTLTKIAKQIKRVVGMGVSVAIVVGGAISGGALRRSATASTMPTPGRIPKLGSSRGQPISRC